MNDAPSKGAVAKSVQEDLDGSPESSLTMPSPLFDELPISSETSILYEGNETDERICARDAEDNNRVCCIDSS